MQLFLFFFKAVERKGAKKGSWFGVEGGGHILVFCFSLGRVSIKPLRFNDLMSECWKCVVWSG